MLLSKGLFNGGFNTHLGRMSDGILLEYLDMMSGGDGSF